MASSCFIFRVISPLRTPGLHQPSLAASALPPPRPGEGVLCRS